MIQFSNKLAIAYMLMEELRLYSFKTISGTKYLPDTSEALQHPFLQIKNLNKKSAWIGETNKLTWTDIYLANSKLPVHTCLP